MNATFSTNALARRKTVQDLVDLRDRALALYEASHDAVLLADGAIKDALVAHREATNGVSRYNHHIDKEKLHFHSRLKVSTRKDHMDVARRLVDTDCWAHVIAITDLETMMDKTAKDSLNQSLLESPPEFTVENVMATLDQFLLDADTIWRRGIATCFSKLDRRFRSHDGWKIGNRIILRNVFDSDGRWSYHSSHRDTIMDVKDLRKICPPTHVVLPVEVVEKLILAGYWAYGPAAICAGTSVEELGNAARAAENTLKRAKGVAFGG